jgi:hypothetical protein
MNGIFVFNKRKKKRSFLVVCRNHRNSDFILLFSIAIVIGEHEGNREFI